MFYIFTSIWQVILIIAILVQLRIIINNKGEFPIEVYGFKIDFKKYSLFAAVCSAFIVVLFIWNFLKHDMRIMLCLFLTLLFVLQNNICREIKKI